MDGVTHDAVSDGGVEAVGVKHGILVLLVPERQHLHTHERKGNTVHHLAY